MILKNYFIKRVQKINIFILALFVCAGSPNFSQEKTVGSDDATSDSRHNLNLLMEKVSHLLEKQEFDKALLELQSVIPKTKEHANLAQLYFVLGYVYQVKNEHPKAIESYKKSLEFKGNFLDSIKNLASLYDMEGENSKAIELRNKAFKIQKKHPKYTELENHFKAWQEARDGDTFFREYQQVETLEMEIFGESHLKSAEIYNKIGGIFYQQGQYENALEILQMSLEIRLKFLGSEHPDVAMSYSNFGTLYKYKKDFKKALDYYNRALNIVKGKYKDIEIDTLNQISELQNEK
ncbi:MAG: tetratricopeptide repeat protein [Leptospiraceae bacterium]|nr:tetratricopeptide repeat protein [Leptospiraceae bacterium]